MTAEGVGRPRFGAIPNSMAASRPGCVRGSALLITLVVLVVVTGVGVASLAGTVLQQRIAGSLQAGTQVFAAAAAALRHCETHVRTDGSSADGAASAAVIKKFKRGLGKRAVGATRAEYFVPDGIGKDFAGLGATRYQVACLIGFNGPVDASRIGGSLRVPAQGPTVYTIRARGARLPVGAKGNQRPSVLLESRVVHRR